MDTETAQFVAIILIGISSLINSLLIRRLQRRLD